MLVPVNKALLKIGSEQIIEFSEPIKNFKSYASYSDEVSGLSNISRIARDFSVSYDDKANWSQWLSVNDTNLLSYLDGSQPSIFIKFRYRVTEKYNNSPIFIKSISLNISVEIVSEGPVEEESMEDDIDYSLTLSDFSQPMEEIEALANKFIAKGRGGILAKYFRVLPDSNNIDFVLGEYSLKGVEKVCDINIVIPNFDIPNDILSFEEFGINFNDFEVHVEPSLFEKTFGKNTKPRNDDFIFFPQANMMFRVASNHSVSGVNERTSFYALSLAKWDNDSNIEHDAVTKEFLKNKIRTQETEYGEELREERENAVNNQVNQTKTISRDGVRDLIHEYMNVINESVYNNGTELMKSYYNLWKIPNTEIAVRYKHQCEIKPEDSFSMSAWFRIPSSERYDYKYYRPQTVSSVSRADRDNVKVEIDNQTANNTLSVLGINENSAIKSGNRIYDVNALLTDYSFDVANLDTTPQMSGFEHSYKANLFYLQSNELLSIDLYDKNLLRVRYGRSEFDFKDIALEEDKWYSVIINVSNIHKYLGVYIYELVDRSTGPSEQRFSTALKSKYKKETIINESILIDKAEPMLTGSHLEISNIRAYKRAIDESDHSYLLANRNIKKPSIAYIIDDAEPVFNLPNMGKGITLIEEIEERRDR